MHVEKLGVFSKQEEGIYVSCIWKVYDSPPLAWSWVYCSAKHMDWS